MKEKTLSGHRQTEKAQLDQSEPPNSLIRAFAAPIQNQQIYRIGPIYRRRTFGSALLTDLDLNCFYIPRRHLSTGHSPK